MWCTADGVISFAVLGAFIKIIYSDKATFKTNKQWIRLKEYLCAEQANGISAQASMWACKRKHILVYLNHIDKLLLLLNIARALGNLICQVVS